MKNEKAADNVKELVALLKHWQELEVATISQTTTIMEKTRTRSSA